MHTQTHCQLINEAQNLSLFIS